MHTRRTYIFLDELLLDTRKNQSYNRLECYESREVLEYTLGLLKSRARRVDVLS